MASALPSAQDCCTSCGAPLEVNVPGPQGPAGTNGTDGTDGLNAFSTIDGGTTLVPPYGDSVDLPLNDPPGSQWIGLGQVIYIASFGYFRVDALPDALTVTIFNLGDSGTGAYAGNVDGDGIIAFTSGARVQPGGLQGPDGSTPGGALLAANNLNDLANFASSRTNLGLGTAAVKIAGTGNGEVPTVVDGGGLTNGEALFANATGIESKSAANSRTALGLGTMATQDASAVTISGGTIAGAIAATTLGVSGAAAFNASVTLGSKLFFVTSAIQSLLAATTVSPNAPKIRVVGNGGAVLLVATPTITSPVSDGQLLIIMGTDDTNTVTLQDDGTLPGSKLELGAATRALGQYDILVLLWDQTTGKWVEVVFTDN